LHAKTILFCSTGFNVNVTGAPLAETNGELVLKDANNWEIA